MAQLICENADFVTAWQASNNVEEVAKATGLATSTCQTRAANLRKKLSDAGLPTLKLMRKGRAKSETDLKALAALIQPATESEDVPNEEENVNTEMEAE